MSPLALDATRDDMIAFDTERQSDDMPLSGLSPYRLPPLTSDHPCTIRMRLIENAQTANNINQRMPAVLIRSRAVEFIPRPGDGT
jgi:hypothetical protein